MPGPQRWTGLEQRTVKSGILGNLHERVSCIDSTFSRFDYFRSELRVDIALSRGLRSGQSTEPSFDRWQRAGVAASRCLQGNPSPWIYSHTRLDGTCWCMDGTPSP